MHSVCHASVGRVQVKGSGEEPDIVLFRIVKKTRGINGREGLEDETADYRRNENS
jgi:hypothetical protein